MSAAALFLLGLAAGGCIGVLAAGLCVAAERGKRDGS